MRRIAIGRVIGLVLAASSLVASVYFFRDHLRRDADFDEWLNARPMVSAVDLSQPGEILLPFRQTCQTSHGEAIFIRCEPIDVATEQLQDLFQGLSGRMTIKTASGIEREFATLNPSSVQEWDGQIMLASFSPFPIGDYMVMIRVDSGAPALADKSQTIYAKYQLCGLEKMPAFLAGVSAIVSGVVCFVSGICVLPGLLHGGIWRETLPGH